MIDKIIYEFKNVSNLKLLITKIDNKKLIRVNLMVIGGLIGIYFGVFILSFKFSVNSLWFLILLPISFLLVYVGNNLCNRYIIKALTQEG